MRWPPVHLSTGTGREEEMGKGGGERRGLCEPCDMPVCAAHDDRTAVGVDVDTQGSSLREDKTYFPLNARVECRAFVSECWFALALQSGIKGWGFPSRFWMVFTGTVASAKSKLK